jgi:predicted phage tail protein
MLREVILYDSLKDKFGGAYKLDIATPGEAIRALSANFKDFAPTIREGSWSLVMGDPETGDSLNDKTLDFTFGNDTSLNNSPRRVEGSAGAV